MGARYAVIIPACNEEPCIGQILSELRAVLDPHRFVICVGVNASSDRTAELAKQNGAIVAETSLRGYGYGCQAAITKLAEMRFPLDSYIFFAADGANRAEDIDSLVAERENNGVEFVLGNRTSRRANWRAMSLQHVFANRLLGLWCGCLCGRYFRDLGPLRLIEVTLFQELRLREWTFGWTIEAQVRAALLGAKMVEVSVTERRRISGTQKVSRVSWRHSLRIGAAIFAAGWRSRFRERAERLPEPDHGIRELAATPHVD